MQTSEYLEKLWQVYREYARYNKGTLLKNDTPADFLAEIERALDYEKNPPAEDKDEEGNVLPKREHYKHLERYLEIINK